MKEKVLLAENITCGYRNFSLKDICMDVRKNEFVGIIGPNGAGKTTLLRVLTRILRPKEGRVRFNGRDIWETPIKELAKKIAVVDQAPNISYMGVGEYVLLGRIPYYKQFQFIESADDIASAENAMRSTEILHLKERPLLEISGGERQLAFIARAIAQEPLLLFLDEPTTHLDIAHQIRTLDLIRKIGRENGLTVVVVLHDLNLASHYCDRLILLKAGAIFKNDTPGEVLTQEVIREVYGADIEVRESSVSGRPYILLKS